MNLDRIEAVVQLLHSQAHVGELEVEGDGWRLHIRKGKGAPYLMEPVPVPEPELDGEPERTSIRAGMVGVYRAPATPLRAGEHLTQGTSVGNIDSMRILNPIVADLSGYVASVLVEDGDPVEYGQELFVLSAEPQTEGAGR